MADFTNIKKLLTSTLGVPYYEDENCVLFCGDALYFQSKINCTMFNTIITSPPYNIGKEYESVKPLDDYVDWSVDWINGASRFLVDDGALLLNLGYVPIENRGHAVPIPYLIWDKIPLYLNQEIVWNYSAGVACKSYLSPRNEKVLWYVKDSQNYTFNLDAIRDKNVKYPNSKKNGKLRVNTLGKNPSDVWEIAKVTTGYNRSSDERTPHPCQFPTDLIDRLVLGFTNEGDIVFDPFIGSGTTFESCIKHNRFCVGFEIKPEYCEIAKKRIQSVQQTVNQIDLFSLEKMRVSI
ncbi:MAG: site-specific DNA-methyltransferase [Planctomycetaceae bacterium]|jgi:adenine-specific DNA-methyltransferase|nr:site-specific DNA-methyltransferase [Planctomycetaceae bacterium]